ncbi:MAG TPA: efflux RND transporter periplasmic adaptor subunit [Terriglobales bacterium]|nr:efflux RND transporter periplasmic adaptor subunit [Terriglobales bacterium]
MSKRPVIVIGRRHVDAERTGNHARHKVAAVLVLAATTCLFACFSSSANSASANLSKPVPAHVYSVAEESTQRQVEAVGSLFPWEESALSSEVEARVAEVLADVGDNVKQGQPLVELDKQELQYAVDAQRGAVMQVRAQLGIGPNDPIPTDTRKLASVQKAEADYIDAGQKYQRAESMFKDKLISREQFDEAATRYQSTKASYNLAIQEVDRLKALLASNEASERLAEKKLADATIRAPYPGSVKTREVHPGEYLKVQSPVMSLVRTDRLRARLAVPEQWAGWVKEGTVVDLHVDAFPGETFHGTVTRINPSVSQESRTFEVEATVNNPEVRLKPGFFAQANLPSQKQEKAIFVPAAAVNYRYGVYKVFIVNGDRVSERQIKPAGQRQDEKGWRFEIAEGLKPGDRVAAALSGELHDGNTIQPSTDTPRAAGQ